MIQTFTVVKLKYQIHQAGKSFPYISQVMSNFPYFAIPRLLPGSASIRPDKVATNHPPSIAPTLQSTVSVVSTSSGETTTSEDRIEWSHFLGNWIAHSALKMYDEFKAF